MPEPALNPARLDVGGQAVIEGVMMRAPRSLAIAVRKPSGEIVLKQDDWRSLSERLRFLKWPGLRGCVVFAEALINGLQALSFSASQAGQTEEERLSPLAIAATMALGFGLAILLFVIVPHALSGYLLALAGSGYGLQSMAFHLLDGLLKIGLFLAYVWGVSNLREVRRLFEYHGAEHKSIYAYEAGAELTVENARRYSRLHPRCGTSFIVLVMLVSILFFSGAFSLLPGAAEEGAWRSAPLMGAKILLMFPVAGLTYELIRYCSRHLERTWTRAVVQPGLWLQKITTREPSDDQLEIALAALRSALAMERAKRELTVP